MLCFYFRPCEPSTKFYKTTNVSKSYNTIRGFFILYKVFSIQYRYFLERLVKSRSILYLITSFFHQHISPLTLSANFLYFILHSNWRLYFYSQIITITILVTTWHNQIVCLYNTKTIIMNKYHIINISLTRFKM